MIKFVKRTLIMLSVSLLCTPVISASAYETNTPILAPPTASLKQMEDWAKSKGATPTFISLAQLYMNLGASHGGVNPVVAYAQAAKETNFGRFGGVLDESYYNPCGLKTASGGGDYDTAAHQRFNSWTEGVSAHLDHLALYAGAPGYPKSSGETYDPRQFTYLFNTANSLEYLGAKWAPSTSYGVEAARLVNEMNNGFKWRLGGATRFETAVEISRAGWTSSQNVILTCSNNFPDSLSGVTLGYMFDAPILLTDKDILSQTTLNEIQRLNAKNVYILGGTDVISDGISNFLKQNNYNVVRISGADRFETAAAIGTSIMQNGGTNTAVIATALDFPDALSISPYAALNKMPVLFTLKDSLNPVTKNFLTTYSVKNVIIPGGTGAVSTEVENELKAMGISVTRIAGADRYQTSLNIAKTYNSSFRPGNFLAVGTNFPDALAGGVLAAKNNLPLFLTDNYSVQSDMLSYIQSRGTGNLYILGGTGVISDNLVQTIRSW